MTGPTDVAGAVASYCERYNLDAHLSLSPLNSIEMLRTNVSPWPNGDKAGCYFFFDEDKTLIYVGVSEKIGGRLNKHFRYNETGKTTPRSTFSKPPCYVQTVAVHETWEAHSMEQFLIRHFQPIDNLISRGPKRPSSPDSLLSGNG